MRPPCPTLPETAVEVARTHLRDILEFAVEHRDRRALVVWDDRCELTNALAEAYRRNLPGADFLLFDQVSPEEVLAAFARLAPGDLAILIQSSSFRLDAYRIRLELFRRSIKVIEHPHLERMQGAEALVYIDALAYDPAYYRGVGGALKQRLDRSERTVIHSGSEALVYPSALESAKLNVGDYRTMKDVGGQFPIGEVFTESKDLLAVHGRVRIAFFGDRNFTVNRPERPITLVVDQGRVVQAIDSTPAFDRVLADIRVDEGEVWLRELGFGLNRALTADRPVSDIGTFERMCGVHLSLGAKHASYKKPGIDKKWARHHVDAFAVTESVTVDDEVVYREGAWIVEPLPIP
jgi:hypothetical protein